MEQTVLALTDKNLVTIECAATSSPLDESLSRIKAFLTERLNERSCQELSSGESGVLIDLGVLGVQPDGKASENWVSRRIYPIRLYHATVILGPLCNPAREGGPCPLCLERRWLAIRPREERETLDALRQAFVYGNNPRLTPSALEAIWTVVEAALAQSGNDDGLLYELYLETLHLSRYRLIADSSCPRCARPAVDTPERATIQLSPRIKRAETDYRLVKATEYNMPEDGYINPICGMLGNDSFADYAHPVTAPVSGKMLMKSRHALNDAWWGGHSNSFTTSRRLGLLEGLERYAGHKPRGKKTVVFDSYKNLQPQALNPLDCGVYQPDFYGKPKSIYIPFTPEREIPWVWGYSFRQERPILVPEQLAYYMDYRNEYPAFVQDCSNGCATGSSLEEAIFFGLLELIERDAFLITWYARLAPRKIDPWSCSDRSTLDILDRIDRLNYDVYLFDTRLDVTPPSVVAVALLREDDLGKLVLAAGSSFDPEDAIRAALCEVAAYIPTFAVRLAQDMEVMQAMARDYRKITRLEHHSLLYGLPEMAPKVDFLFQNAGTSTVAELYEDWIEKRPHSHDLLDDLHYCIDEIVQLGMDVIVVEQTCPEQEQVGIKAASVIVPGLLPIDFGWGRDRVFDMPRLRTVPRTAGYLEKDFDPALSNPAPHPFP
ncbi:MAG TPA: TOMM precursor leader peptide-binding protein [Ktedonobacteraceae bacterium]|nr:TOMM precursor leader peptide-binding protein [Ktedonobacteraceae bacterium]